MPSKLSITATFLFVYFLCDSPAAATLVQQDLVCITSLGFPSFTFNTYTEAYFTTKPNKTEYIYNDTVNTVDIISCDPATTTGCTKDPELITLQCTEDGWKKIGTKTISCRDGYFLNKDDFKCYSCTKVTGNNDAIASTSKKTNTAQDCYIPGNKTLQNDRGFFNYDSGCYYATATIPENVVGYDPLQTSA